MNALLFTTTTCPKCPAFKEFVAENISFPVEILDETLPEFSTQIQHHQVSAAPTLIIFEAEREILRTSETSELADFLITQK